MGSALERGCAVTRVLTLAAAIAVGAGLPGCASAWDTLSSKRFRNNPFGTLFRPEDPVQVLRENPADGDARAWAFQRLTEPAAEGRPAEDQEFALETLSTAATSDPSPWVRIAAVDALSKFQDPRAPGVLVAAYHQATGRPPAPTEEAIAASPTMLPAAAGRAPTPTGERFGLSGPQGFSADQVATLRGRTVDALAKSGRPEAVALLAQIAAGEEPSLNADPESRDFVRQRAVTGLRELRTPESVNALAQVLATEHGRDVTLTNLAHGGLMDLTGQNLPADPKQWQAVVQAGYNVAPARTPVQKAIGFDTP